MPEGNRLLLAIDTSTEITGLALYDGESVYELMWRAGRNQTTGLLAQIHYLLGLNSLALGDVRAIGVAVGPGTFNGLRVGLSTAKGLSYGLDVPIIGVDTLEATAYPYRRSRHPIRAFVPAGRGRTVFCDYRNRNGRWIRSGELHNRPFDELTTGLTETTLIVGESPRGFSVADLKGTHADFPSLAMVARRPSYLAEVAYQRWDKGDVDEIAALEPVYVHGDRARKH